MIVASIYAILGVHFYAESSEENFGTFSRAIYTVSDAVTLIWEYGLIIGNDIHLFSFVILCLQHVFFSSFHTYNISFFFHFIHETSFSAVISYVQHLFLLSFHTYSTSFRSLYDVCKICFFRHLMHTSSLPFWYRMYARSSLFVVSCMLHHFLGHFICETSLSFVI